MPNPKNDIFYTAALLEYVARKTKNQRKTIAQAVGINGIREIYEFADVSHCLPFEETADEVITKYGIREGEFSPESDAEKPPGFLAIGQNYANIVIDSASEADYPDTLYKVLCSEISTWMTLYDNAFFYSPREYMALEYRALYAI